MPSPAPSPARELVQLPRSSTRLQRNYAHLKLLTAVRELPFSVAFEGKILAPGALIRLDNLPDPAVVLECVGPIGERRRGREVLWILWKYDRLAGAWRELARAGAPNWEWCLALREPAIRALHPKSELVDLTARSYTLAGEIMGVIDGKLEPEINGVRVNVLASLYDQVAGRIAALC